MPLWVWIFPDLYRVANFSITIAILKRMGWIRYFVLIALCQVATKWANAQNNSALTSNIKFEQLTDGLSEKSVTSIIQDQHGFLWFGTRNGLNQYDGIEFKVYEYIHGDSTSLSSSFVNCMAEDKDGNIWVGTMDAGLNLYNRNSDNFTRFQTKPNDPESLSDNWVTDLFIDSHDNVWIGTEGGGLNVVYADSKAFKHFKNDIKDPLSLANNHVRSICEDSNGNIWVATYGGGLDRFDTGGQRFIHHRHEPGNVKSLSSNYLNSFLKDSDGQIWIGTREGLSRLVPKDNGVEFQRLMPNIVDPTGLVHNIVLSISEDNYNRLWLGMENGGLSIYDKQTGQFSNFWPNPLDPTSVGANSIWAVYKDNIGTMWLAARNRGLNKWDQYQTKFIHHILPPSGGHTLANNDIICFVEDKEGNLWIGTDGGGLNHFNRKTNEVKSYVHDINDPKSIGSNSVISLEIDSYGDLWAGTWEGGLNRFDKKTGTFQRFESDPDDASSIGSNYVFSIFEDSQRRLWVGAFYEGLDLFDRKTGTFVHYEVNPDDPESLSHNRVFTMFEDSRDNIWIGTEGGGLLQMTFAGDGEPVFKTYTNNPKDSTTLSSNVVNAIYEDTKGTLWVSTWAGLNKFDYEKGTFETFRKNDGLADNVVNGILEDERGKFWISTNQGISEFDPESRSFKNYNTADGLQEQEFVRGAYLKSQSGEFFFGGVNGFNSFYPGEVKENPHIPPVYITNFWIYNEEVRPGAKGSVLAQNIIDTKEITLTYHQNEFSFEFAALNYSQAFKNSYSYMLEGYDEHWHEAGTQRTASYTKVPHGDYVFRVKASNNDGLWNEEGASLRIIVTPPWWATWWAYAVYVCIGIGLLLWYRQVLIYRERLKSDLRLEHMELTKMQEMDAMKSNFFANISHEFRTPLTLMLSPLKSMYSGAFRGDVRKQYGVMIRSGERLLRLINQLLDLSKLGSGSMKLEASRTDVVEFLKPIAASFSSYATQKKLSYSYNHPNAPLEAYIDHDKIEKIVTNLLSNAFKFTIEGEISLNVSRISMEMTDSDVGGEFVQITVKDCGVGIPREHLQSVFDRFYQADVDHHGDQEGTGIGLSLTRELVELHRGRISVKSTLGEGSCFKVLIPMGKAHLQDSEIVEPEKVGAVSIGHVVEELEERDKQNTGEAAIVKTDPKEGKPLVLIVEDNADLRTYMKESLEHSYEIIDAANGKIGLEKCIELVPDLIISDIMMPLMDGVEMCHLVKTDSRISHVPVILLTAKADLEDKLTGLETGADDYITKPFDSRFLEVRVRNLIKTRELMRERFMGNRKLVLEPKEITITPLDEVFMKKVLKTIEDNIGDSEFRVEDLGREVAMSRMHFYRKVKALTGQTAVEFIRTIRLKRAAQMLNQNQLTVSEITYAVGFNDLQYFRNRFKKYFGVSPSEYASQFAGDKSEVESEARDS